MLDNPFGPKMPMSPGRTLLGKIRSWPGLQVFAEGSMAQSRIVLPVRKDTRTFWEYISIAARISCRTVSLPAPIGSTRIRKIRRDSQHENLPAQEQPVKSISCTSVMVPAVTVSGALAEFKLVLFVAGLQMVAPPPIGAKESARTV